MQHVMDWMYVSFQNTYSEVQITSVAEFGVRKLLRLNGVIRIGPWSDRITVLIRRDMSSLYMGIKKTYSQKTAICKSRAEPLPDINSVSNTLILDFQSPEMWENKFLLSKSASLWYFVMAAWVD